MGDVDYSLFSRELSHTEDAMRGLEKRGGPPHDGGMDDVIRRVGALEGDMKEVKGLLADKVVPMLVRIDERLNHSATKAELAEKPGKAYLWAVLGVLIATVLAATVGGATVVSLFR